MDTETGRQIRIKRLIYRASYTGMKETDLLLGQFAARHLASLSDSQLDCFEQMLDAGDPAILGWVKGDIEVPDRFNTDVLNLIREFKKTL